MIKIIHLSNAPVPSYVYMSVFARSLLPSTCARRSDLGGQHQIADILLQELVVAIKLIVFLFDGFNAVEDLEE